ncbi:hypothetical protein [Sedimenticola hydrogenitrophicus]|uniref:hypothetical protein n=1 Tax=Sedimenticola hydrogenitrophicus TaxID=2967975 RepID=UPI0023B12F44|nr:hypothetical protein [Sedimenticola hydrogenitrophicus]
MQESEKKQKKKWVQLTVSSLEADVAYFDARLALLNEKKTSYYQLAQLRAYTELERVLSEVLARLRARPKPSPSAVPASAIEVSTEADSLPLNGVLADNTIPCLLNDEIE